MLENQNCAASFSPWKEKLNQIQPNDFVFFYSNGTGIIARKMATGVVEIADYEDEKGIHEDEDDEYYMHLNRIEKNSNPVSSSPINQHVGFNVVLAQTMVSLYYDRGLKLWQGITKVYLK